MHAQGITGGSGRTRSGQTNTCNAIIVRVMAPGACVCHFTSVKASPGVAFSELNPSEARKRQDKLAAVAALRQQLVAGDSKRMDEQCTRVLGFALGG